MYQSTAFLKESSEGVLMYYINKSVGLEWIYLHYDAFAHQVYP